MSDSFENISVPDSSISSQHMDVSPASTHSEPMSQTSSEPKYVPQDRVNKLVGEVRSQSYERGYKRAQEELSANRQEPVTQQSYMPNQLTADHVAKIAAEQVAAQFQAQQKQYAEQQQQEEYRQFAQSFNSKLVQGKDTHPDFEQVTQTLRSTLDKIPEIAYLTHEVGNTAEVFYDLAKHPEKIAQLVSLARSGTPEIARQVIHNISAGLDINKQAQANAARNHTNEPIQHLEPTNLADGGNDGNSFEYLKSQKFLRR